ncbi:winged helix-turn-helix domain-containing protein [Streptomyces sp. GS7]|uniref:winged helix-turn-helix domain-containing protein n=1 Tax=Streptomyces sp. GS7 TaxID=2692234 RepID=UPI001318B408|nr:hypothetical protein GR130_22170 [Streptomyces sp. GS7]
MWPARSSGCGGCRSDTGWSWQAPWRRALKRDEDAIQLWKKGVWPLVEAARRRSGLDEAIARQQCAGLLDVPQYR